MSSLDFLWGSIELLVLAAAAGEEDQAGLVGIETGDISGQGFRGGIDTAVVNGDTDGQGELAGDTGFL